MSGGGNTTTTQRMEPWGPAQGGLRDAIGAAGDLFRSGGFSADPYQGPRVADFSGATQRGMNQIMQTANGGTPGVDAAMGSLQGMMSGQQQYRDLDGVRSNILGNAIPAAVAQFSGSGMPNSSVAMDQVGGAASSALAPFEYDAYNQQQNRSLQAAGMMPGLEAARYMPGQMMQQVGAQRDLRSQAQIDANMQRHYEQQGQQAQNFQGYLNAMMGLGGLGGQQSATAPGPSTGARVAGAGLGGLGAYGALAMNPVTAPFALAGGGLAGLMGLLR